MRQTRTRPQPPSAEDKLRERLRTALRRLAESKRQLAEAQEALRAIARGQVDSLVVPEEQGTRIVELQSSASAYQVLVEAMTEGALTLDVAGNILYANSRFCQMIGQTLEQVIGEKIEGLVPAQFHVALHGIIQRGLVGEAEGELALLTGEGTFPVKCSMRAILLDGVTRLGATVVNLTDLKHTEQALRESESRYRLLFERNLAGISHATFDPDLLHARRIDCNEAYAHILGYDSRRELIGQAVSDVHLSPPDWVEYVRALSQQGMQKNREIRLRRRDGSPVWVLVNAGLRQDGGQFLIEETLIDMTEPKRDEEALRQALEEIRQLNATLEVRVRERTVELQAANVFLQDEIAEGLRADQALRDSEERYRMLVELSPEAVAVHVDGILVYINTTGAKLLGANPADLIGKPLIDFVHPDDRVQALARVREMRKRGRPAPLAQERFVRMDGAVIDVEVMALATLFQGTPAVQVIFRDITERLHVEQALAESRRRLQDMMDGSSSVIFVKDLDGHFTFVNRQFGQFFGKPANEFLGKSDYELFPPEQAGVFRRNDHAVVQSGQPVRSEETVNFPDGRHCIFLSDKFPLFDQAGRIYAVCGMATDITDRKAAEERIEQLNRDLEQQTTELQVANRELESFAYSVSHDLRTPLAAIEGFSKSLVLEHSGQLPPDVEEMLELVHANTETMNRLIQDLLNFSRTTRRPLHRSTVRPEEIVREVLDELSTKQDGRAVQIHIDPLPPCQADPNLLRQVYMNLLSNALKFTRKCDSATIEVGYGDADGENAYFVRDNGVGFDAENAEKLFGVFQRFHSEEDYEGTGVGLAIVERIVHRHGGRIWAESQVDRGATFYFTLAPAVVPPVS